MNNISATKKGIIISILIILVSVICFYILHLPENGNSQYVVSLIFIAGLIWVNYSFKLKNAEANFKAYFSEGFKAFIVVTLFMAVYTFIFYKLNPQILENGILANNILIQKEGNRTAIEIQENANKMRSIFMPMMLSINTIKYLFLGSLISVVSAGFLSQKK